MGKLVVIEGTDGSGKATQSDLLVKRLIEEGHTAIKYSFPGYTKTFFGREVGNFLNGEFGTIDQVHPKLASCLYALDRFEQLTELRADLDKYDYVVCDRYVESNMAHQGCKLDEPDQMFKWIEKLEYEILGLPRPDIFIFLSLPVEVSRELILEKAKREYTDHQKDLHEADDGHLQKAFDVYDYLARLNEWLVIGCTDEQGKLESREQIAEWVYNTLRIEEKHMPPE
jgi:dTMP kinase